MHFTESVGEFGCTGLDFRGPNVAQGEKQSDAKDSLIRVKWLFVRSAARARSDPARDAGRLAMARSFHVKVRHERSLD